MPIKENHLSLTFIFSIMIGLRPASELLWQYKLFGSNLQSWLSLLIFIIAIFLVFTMEKIQRYYLPFFLSIVFFSMYITIFSLLYGDIVFLKESLKTITSLVIGLAIISTLNKEHLRIIIAIFTVSVILLTIFSYLQHFGLYDFYYYTGCVIKGQIIGRVSGGLSHPNDLNRNLIFFIFLLFFCLPKLSDLIRLSTLFVIALPIYWSYHRTTYLCTIVILILYLTYKRKYLILTILSGVFATVIALKIDYIRFFVFGQRLNFTNGIDGSRFRICNESIRLFFEAPFFNKLFGSGLFPGGRTHGDGDLPRIIYAYGVTGFVGYIGVLLSILHAAMKNINRYAFFSLFCLFSIGVIYSIFVDVTRYPAFLIMFFVCLRGSLLIIEEKARNAQASAY